MRINFAGSLTILNPIVLVFTADGAFSAAPYLAAGYSVFEAMCIGGGGGRGGNYFGKDFNHTANTLHIYGGEGGGGGSQHVKGVLSALPDPCGVVVGAAGTAGTDRLTDSTVEYDVPTTDGGDGGHSSFNDGALPTCRASGGKGGKRVYTATVDIDPASDGGDGGAGNSTTAGGGGTGGLAGTLTSSPFPEPPVSPGVGTLIGGVGTLVGAVGKGGGGGPGGMGIIAPVAAQRIKATKGEKGSYNPSDQSVMDTGGPLNLDTGLEIWPGAGGGARVTPLNDSIYVYGRGGVAGIVVVRLTVD
jgi:hypothetical protein